jgi:hypothetical protein
MRGRQPRVQHHERAGTRPFGTRNHASHIRSWEPRADQPAWTLGLSDPSFPGKKLNISRDAPILGL